MLGKLCAHELKGLWKKAVVLLTVMVVAGVCGTGAVTMASVLADTGNPYLTASSSTLVAVLFMLSLFLAFVVWAALVAMFVLIAVRFYRTMFTDEGYLALTLPVETSTLVAAKYLVGLLVMVVFALVAVALAGAMVLAFSGGDPEAFTGMLAMMGGMFGIVHASSPVASVVGLVSVLVGTAYQLALAFVSLALGAWWARRHKVAVAVALFLGIGWLVSLVFSMGAFAVAMGGVQAMAFAASLSLAQMATNAALAVGAVLLTAYLVKRKIDLS